MENKGFVSGGDFRWRIRLALISVTAALFITAAKLVTAYLTNSLAMYSEAGHSAVDTIAITVTFLAIRVAAKPPDEDHQFGHAKFESFAALFELSLLLVIGGGIVYHAVQRLTTEAPRVIITWPVFVVMGVSIAVEAWRSLALLRAARKTGSEALAASSTHFITDFLDSFVVVFGLAMTALGYPRADSYAALFVAAVIVILCVRTGRQAFFSLTDKAPRGMAVEIEKIVMTVERVIGVHDIRVRRAGSQFFTEMHVDLDAKLSLEEVHDVLDAIENAVHKEYPSMHVTTHPEPVDTETQAGE